MRLAVSLTLICTRAAQAAHSNRCETLIKMLYTPPVRYVPPLLTFVHFPTHYTHFYVGF